MQRPTLFRGALLLLISALTGQGHGQKTEDARYPLRLHVLAIDKTHRTERMQPNWCSASVPSLGGDAGGSTGVDSCGGSASLGGGEDDFAGAGRGDLVNPPGGATQALSFAYEGCSRVRVPPGFQGLAARWKKPGKLEVLIPSDSLTEGDRPLPVQRCTLTATVYEYVYLRLANGSILKVSQEAYARKPALRRFLSGGAETLQTREATTVSVKQLMGPQQ